MYLIVHKVSCQNLKYNFSTLSEGYYGRVKSVTSYILQFDFIDTSRIDTILTKSGKIQFVKYFDIKGLLVKADNYNEMNDCRIKYYYHNSDTNIVLITTNRSGSEDIKVEMFDYADKHRMITQTSNFSQNIPIGNKIKQVFVKRLIFDDLGRHIQTDFLDNEGMIIMTSRSYYDSNSKVIQFENFNQLELNDKYIQTYDSNGYLKINQSVDINGNFTKKAVYSRPIKDVVISEIFDEAGVLIVKNKVISVRDDQGNIIKKYFYDLINNTSTMFEYAFEYYLDKP